MPVINTDYLMNQFYTNIKEYWDVKNVNTSNIASISAFWNKKLLVNIGGGPRDLQVPSSLTISPHSDVQVLVILLILFYIHM